MQRILKIHFTTASHLKLLGRVQLSWKYIEKMSSSYSEKSMKRPAGGKFSYNDDIRKFQGKKHAESIKKKELETKRFQKAAALRKYAKLCKAEGIQSDRVHMGKKEDRPTGDIKEKEKVEYKPFRRAEREAERLQAVEAEKERQRQENLQLKEEAIRKRDEKRKALSKKTKKGQPVLGNQIKNILEKLQTAH